LHNRSGGSRDNLDRLYDPANTPDLGAYRGKRAAGKWTIRVQDCAAQDAGKLAQIGVHLFLPPATFIRAGALKSSRPTAARHSAAALDGRIKRNVARKPARGKPAKH
jgi:subtilisin-like proprotein convertase family protein